MNKNILISVSVFLVVLVGGYLLVSSDSGENPSNADASGSENSAAETTGSGSVAPKPGSDTVVTNGSPEKDAEDTLIVGESGLAGVRYVEISAGAEVDSPEQAQAVVDQHSSEIGIEYPSALTVVDNSEDDFGNSYYQIDQFYQDIPVYGASALLEVNNNQAELLSGLWLEDIQLDTQPGYEAEEALAIATEILGSTNTIDINIYGEPQLLVYVSNLNTHLAWRLHASLYVDGEIYNSIVDAHDPVFLLRSELRRD